MSSITKYMPLFLDSDDSQWLHFAAFWVLVKSSTFAIVFT